jgi:hypothetical protein
VGVPRSTSIQPPTILRIPELRKLLILAKHSFTGSKPRKKRKWLGGRSSARFQFSFSRRTSWPLSRSAASPACALTNRARTEWEMIDSDRKNAGHHRALMHVEARRTIMFDVHVWVFFGVSVPACQRPSPSRYSGSRVSTPRSSPRHEVPSLGENFFHLGRGSPVASKGHCKYLSELCVVKRSLQGLQANPPAIGR